MLTARLHFESQTESVRNGDRYLGSWEAGAPHGTGRMEYASGSVYDGGWEAPGASSSSPGAKAAKRDGGGATRALPHHDIEPLARRAVYHGDGRLKNAGGSTYEGQWLFGDRHGAGRSSHPSGEWYSGAHQHGVKSGQGEGLLASGDRWNGMWMDDEPSGSGVLTSMSGDVFTGSLASDGTAARQHGHAGCRWSANVAQCRQNVWPHCRVTGRARSSKQTGQVSTSSVSVELLSEPSILELNTVSPSANIWERGGARSSSPTSGRNAAGVNAAPACELWRGRGRHGSAGAAYVPERTAFVTRTCIL